MYSLSSKSRLRYFFCYFLLTSNLLAVFFAVSCGRRGDPFLTYPDNIAEERENIVIKERDKAEMLSKGTMDIAVVKPDAPSGLVGVFTGKTVVLSWTEVAEQGIESYRIYRSDNDEFKKTGETVIPAFIDEEIQMKSRYRYKVTAVGKAESDFSNEIEIITEGK